MKRYARIPPATWALVLTIVFMHVAAHGATLEDDGFCIEYEPGDDALARRTRDILRNAMTELGPKLPIGNEPIHVLIAGTPAGFACYGARFGEARVAGIAEAHRGRIILRAPRLLPREADYAGIVRHELIHVLLYRNFEVANMPRWLNEGIAMTLSRERRWTGSLYVARMYTQGELLSYDELTHVLAWGGPERQFGAAYAQSLSMTRFLIDRLGERKFWDLVSAIETMSFEDALQSTASWSPEQLIDAWRGSLWKTALAYTILSGISVFQVILILAAAAYVRRRRRARRIIEQWAREEQHDDAPDSPGDIEPVYEWEYDDEQY